MKLLVLVMLITLTGNFDLFFSTFWFLSFFFQKVYFNVTALTLSDLIERELANDLRDDGDDENSSQGSVESSVELSGIFGKRDSANRERLKQCIKCVGNERIKGNNIKNSAAYCNNICKRHVQFGNFRPKGK